MTQSALDTEDATLAAPELHRLLEHAGSAALDGVGWIRVAGGDRVRWLNGMVTNSIQELKPGDGNYSFVLNAQGRIQGDLWTFADEDATLLLQTARDRVQELMTLFDRFIIMDDVELEGVSGGRFGFAVAGPGAAELLQGLGLEAGEAARTRLGWRGGVVEVIRGHSPLVPRFELWTASEELAQSMREALATTDVGQGTFERLRILEGTPRFGVDIREKELPQETGQTRALHFSKGCYLGQEIVERIRSRGNVHRGFGGFRLDGPSPAAGAVLEADGKTVGELTSVADIPLRGGTVQVALGYARREFTERGVALAYSTPDGPGRATPTPLPMRLGSFAAPGLGITQD